MTPWGNRVRNNHKKPHKKPTVAVVGGGGAGLTAAYELAKRGFDVSLYEAAPRLGGRIRTDHGAFGPQEQFCEKGGEGIDSAHHAIRDLAKELNLKIQNVGETREGEELFYFGGEFYRSKDFLHYTPGQKTTEGAYLKLADYIRKDYRNAQNNSRHESQLDALSIEAYLKKAQEDIQKTQKTRIPSWVIDSIKTAYKSEFGAEPEEMSALLLINRIGVSRDRPFEMNGANRDESCRIEGGNDALVDALQEASKQKGVRILLSHTLAKIDYREGGKRGPVYLEFNDGSRRKTRSFDYVVCTIPFTKLREVEGLDALASRGLLSQDKLNAIKSLTYGNVVKIMIGMIGKPWKNNPHFPYNSNGVFKTDDPYLQNAWIASDGQAGEDSILAVLVSGDEAKRPLKVIMSECKQAAVRMLGKPEEELFTRHRTGHDWSHDENTRGGYSFMRPGQYTTLRHITGIPEMKGRLSFAGEHTDPEFFGYMNGAVHSGLREARRIAEMERDKQSEITPPQAGVG